MMTQENYRLSLLCTVDEHSVHHDHIWTVLQSVTGQLIVRCTRVSHVEASSSFFSG